MQFLTTQTVTSTLTLFSGAGAPRPGEASTTTAQVIRVTDGYRLDAADHTFKASPTTPTFPVTPLPAPNNNFYVVSFSAGILPVGQYVIRFDAAGAEVYTEDVIVTDTLVAVATAVTSIESALTAGGNAVAAPDPIDPAGNVTLIRGNDYLVADGRGLAFTVSGCPSLTGSVVTLNLHATVDGSLVSIPGTAVSANTALFNVPRSITAGLYVGANAYTYVITAMLLDSSVVTPAAGSVSVE